MDTPATPRKRGPRSRMQPTTEEQRQSRPRPRACRRLFPEDHPLDPSAVDNMLNQMNEQINRDLDDACNKYNFDFRNEVPLEGNWVWERIGEPETEAKAQTQPPPPPPLERLSPAAPQEALTPPTDPSQAPPAPLTPAL